MVAEIWASAMSSFVDQLVALSHSSVIAFLSTKWLTLASSAVNIVFMLPSTG